MIFKIQLSSFSYAQHTHKPETWILGQALHTGPCMIIPWLQLHGDLQWKTHWLLILLITDA